MKNKKELKYNAWNDHLNNTRDRTNYSVRRMDLLIITICGAGIYIIFEILREFKTGNIEIDNSILLVLSGIAFLVTIIINFVSQLTGSKANGYEEKYILLVLSEIEGNKINKNEFSDLDCLVNRFNFWTGLLNTFSIIFMFTGLVLLSIFNYLLV